MLRVVFFILNIYIYIKYIFIVYIHVHTHPPYAPKVKLLFLVKDMLFLVSRSVAVVSASV